MKRRNRFVGWITCLFLVLLAGCSNEMEVSVPGDNTFYISSTISLTEDARLSGSHFEANDRIGLYMIPYQSDKVTPGDFPQDAHASNVEYIYNGTSWNPASTVHPTWPGQRKTDIYGYYPYSSELSELTSDEYQFSVRTDQRAVSDYMQSDFLWAKTAGLAPVKNVPLTFYHRMSLLSVNVLSQIEVSRQAGTEMEVSLVNVNPSASIALSEGKVASGASEGHAEVYALLLAEPETGYQKSYKSILPPQTIAKNDRFIKIRLDGVNYYYQPPEEIELKSGTHFIFNIVITKKGLNVYMVIINEWQDGGVFDENLGQKAPWVVDLNAINWNKSWVHNICYKGIPVARVSKEYVFKSGLIDVQAVVVYPIDTAGKSDLTKGFVAQVMNRTRNASTGLYEPNSASVHGGSVNFNSASNTLVSYTAGTSAFIQKVEIEGDGTITQANDNAIALLTTEPVVMTDVDRNNYPIVKIGTQYWIAQNYYAEHYQNGDDLPYYYFNDSRDYKATLGALYTWTTLSDSRGIAPEDWQVPGEPDWQSIYRYLTPNAGMKLKANTMWTTLTTNDNVTGFSALPGGRRTDTGVYNEIIATGQWWAATSYGTAAAYRMYLVSGDYAMHLVTLGTSYTQSLRLLRKTPL